MLIHCTSNAKVIIIHLIVGLIKKYIVWNIALQNELVLKPGSQSKNTIKFELDLSNYATKRGLKKVTRADTSSLAAKKNLTS